MSKASKKKARKAYSAKKKANEALKKDNGVHPTGEPTNAEHALIMELINNTKVGLENKDGQLVAPFKMSYEDSYEFVREKCKVCNYMRYIVDRYFETIEGKSKKEIKQLLTKYVIDNLKFSYWKIIKDPTVEPETIMNLLNTDDNYVVIEFAPKH
jgi:hypothetical protein